METGDLLLWCPGSAGDVACATLKLVAYEAPQSWVFFWFLTHSNKVPVVPKWFCFLCMDFVPVLKGHREENGAVNWSQNGTFFGAQPVFEDFAYMTLF